jgi:signal transduction histidine kinase
MACECHRVLSREFERLLRPPIEAVGPQLRMIEDSPNRERESAAALETMREISGRLLVATIREQEARDEAEAANRAKDQFLATVSHELRTPLNAILGWCAILRERRDETPERGLKVIQRNAQALLKFVEELLDAARLTAGTLSIQSSPTDLTDIICSAVDAVKPAADMKDVAVRVTPVDAAIRMMGDPDRLRQVFLNVLSNALKFTDAGGSIEVCAGRVGSTARVSVRDTGSGIAPDLLGHVFERFIRGADLVAGPQGPRPGSDVEASLIDYPHCWTLTSHASCTSGRTRSSPTNALSSPMLWARIAAKPSSTVFASTVSSVAILSTENDSSASATIPATHGYSPAAR